MAVPTGAAIFARGTTLAPLGSNVRGAYLIFSGLTKTRRCLTTARIADVTEHGGVSADSRRRIRQ
jgi:hypothetical protein